MAEPSVTELGECCCLIFRRPRSVLAVFIKISLISWNVIVKEIKKLSVS